MSRRFLLLGLLFYCSFFSALSQKSYTTNTSVFKVDFELINNLIVVPIQVNTKELSFVLDTGASRAILFNSILTDSSLVLNNSQKVFLKGLGNSGRIEALKSANNTFKIGQAVNLNQELYVINDASVNFGPKLGVPIHGVIGYDVLKDFVVEVNYVSKQLKFINYNYYKKKIRRNRETLAFSFYNRKPYVTVNSKINDTLISTKLLVDTGSSDALWLFENKDLGITPSNEFFDDFLGYGLSGDIYGKRSKIDAILLNSFEVDKPKVAFPDADMIESLHFFKGRNGSLGGELLKRFKVTFDYRNKELILKRNRHFNTPFSYNKSGVVLEHDGLRLVLDDQALMPVKDVKTTTDDSPSQSSFKPFYTSTKPYVIQPLIKVSSIRKNSPADNAGLRPGDIVLSINRKNVKYHSMQSMQDEFFQEDGDHVAMVIERYGVKFTINFKLKSPLY